MLAYGKDWPWGVDWGLQLTGKLYMDWLKDERNSWRYDLENGLWNEPYVLQQYREHRESNLWRSTREVEKLCEYVLYLEDKLAKKDKH